MSADAIDPWEAILSALLSIRFPDDLAGLNVELADALAALAALAPWAHDGHVILAREHLSAATDEAARRKAAGDALAQLTEALNCGSPYFDYANQLFAELIGVLQEYFDNEEGADAKRKEAAAVRHRWQQDQPLQSKAGASFSWRGAKPVASAGSSPDEQGPGGVRGATLLFAGQIHGGNIRLDPAQSVQPAKEASAQAVPSSIDFGDVPQECPALKRSAGPDNDPNLGRFGGRDTVEGYSLKTTFDGDPDGEVTTITMTVATDRDVYAPSGAVVWFCLHPTFHPQWVKVLFGNGRAVCSTHSLGGFTVGVWLPHAAVELESDLSQLPSAPHIVREL